MRTLLPAVIAAAVVIAHHVRAHHRAKATITAGLTQPEFQHRPDTRIQLWRRLGPDFALRNLRQAVRLNAPVTRLIEFAAGAILAGVNPATVMDELRTYVTLDTAADGDFFDQELTQ